MNLALVHDQLIKLGGAERVLSVLADLYPKAPIYTLIYDEKKVGHVFPKARIRPSPLQHFPRFLQNRRRYFFPMMPRFIESFDFSDFDLVLSSSTAFSHGIVTDLKTKHLSYCHSPMRYAWDWTHPYLEENHIYGFKRRVVQKLLSDLRVWDYYASDRVDQYLANSRNVEQRIKKYYRKESAVLYPPVNLDRFSVSKNRENYFLIVSTLAPYKNVELAVHLFNKIQKKLVIIGDGDDRARLERLAGPTIDFLGYKPDEVVREYLQNCRALIFPGEEDFGIVPVEAMACGKPVLAYGKGGVLESVVAGISGEFFNEPTVDSMEDGLARLMAHEPKYDVNKIRHCSEPFAQVHFEEGIRSHVEKLLSCDVS